MVSASVSEKHALPLLVIDEFKKLMYYNLTNTNISNLSADWFMIKFFILRRKYV